MQMIANKIYPDDYQVLKKIIMAIANDNNSLADSLVKAADQNLHSIPTSPRRLQVQLFLEAIKSRLGGIPAENLYLVGDQGQQIQLFNFMSQQFPVVSLAQSIANQLLMHHLHSSSQATILDIGIGTGQQMVTLLKEIQTSAPSLNAITIIGIEPSRESLDIAQKRLDSIAIETNIQYRFVGINTMFEELDESDWELIQKETGGSTKACVINASFALHHVQPINARLQLFQKLRTLQPKAFLIIEPYADYTSDNLLLRFNNAWHHYGLTFKAIDTIEAAEEDKSLVKRVFFGREMIDVLAKDSRVEIFETSEMWVDKLEKAGFSISAIKPRSVDSCPSFMTIESTNTHINFNIDGYPIVGLICVN
jgi:hypothetical protein